MVIGRHKNTTYYKNSLGFTGAITDNHVNAKLVIRSPKGKIIEKRYYRDKTTAYRVWNKVAERII